MIRRSAVLLALSSLFVAVPAGAGAFDLLVQPDVIPCVRTVPRAPIVSTIQAAVNAVGTGQTIGVCRGTYREAVVVGTAGVTIRAVSQASVAGPGLTGVGFHVTAPDVTIQGLDIYGFDEGVLVAADRATIRGNDLHDHGSIAVDIASGNDSRVITNRIHRNFNGIVSFAGAGLEIANNVVSDGIGTGIVVQETDNADIHHNTVVRNAEDGIAVYYGSDVTIRRNAVRDNLYAGIFVYTSSAPTLDRNTVILNGIREPGNPSPGVEGIHIVAARDCVVRNNTVSYNGGEGIWAVESGNCVFARNDVYRNGRDGIRSENTQGGDRFACNAARFNNVAKMPDTFDCRWDGSDSPNFLRNLCLTQEPAGSWSAAPTGRCP